MTETATKRAINKYTITAADVMATNIRPGINQILTNREVSDGYVITSGLTELIKPARGRT